MSQKLHQNQQQLLPYSSPKYYWRKDDSERISRLILTHKRFTKSVPALPFLSSTVPAPFFSFSFFSSSHFPSPKFTDIANYNLFPCEQRAASFPRAMLQPI